VNFYETVARKKLNSPEWKCCKLEAVDGYTICTGAIPIGTFRSGPRKGCSKFPPLKDCDTVIISSQDIEIAKAEYRKETGNCPECEGSGKVICGWGKDGTRYRECKCVKGES